jgi:hypothetical protein
MRRTLAAAPEAEVERHLRGRVLRVVTVALGDTDQDG